MKCETKLQGVEGLKDRLAPINLGPRSSHVHPHLILASTAQNTKYEIQYKIVKQIYVAQWREPHEQSVSHNMKERLQCFKVELHCPELDSKVTREKLEMQYFQQ